MREARDSASEPIACTRVTKGGLPKLEPRGLEMLKSVAHKSFDGRFCHLKIHHSPVFKIP